MRKGKEVGGNLLDTVNFPNQRICFSILTIYYTASCVIVKIFAVLCLHEFSFDQYQSLAPICRLSSLFPGLPSRLQHLLKFDPAFSVTENHNRRRLQSL